MIDIYFEPNYGKLYEKIENGTCEVFRYSSAFGSLYHMFIKREIPVRVNNKTYYDLVTPYGYGGPLITDYKENKREQLLKEFEREFQSYCKKNDIVSEFIRFHPLIRNADDFKDCYDVTHIRNTVGTNLAAFDEPFKSEFSKRGKQIIKKALREGVSYKITEKPSDLSKFKDIYYSTMSRKEASDYYYFNDDYFNQCVEALKEHLLLVEALYEQRTIAMGFFFKYNKVIHSHLEGTLSNYFYLSPSYILNYAVTVWGKENGYELIHHGGGRTNDLEDSLYLFKKKFGKNTEFKFSIGKKIWNNNIYDILCADAGVTTDIDFFPAYRCI